MGVMNRHADCSWAAVAGAPLRSVTGWTIGINASTPGLVPVLWFPRSNGQL